jgi:hypothetical protein
MHLTWDIQSTFATLAKKGADLETVKKLVKDAKFICKSVGEQQQGRKPLRTGSTLAHLASTSVFLGLYDSRTH